MVTSQVWMGLNKIEYSLIQEVPYKCTQRKSDDGRQGKCRGRSREGYTGNKDDGLDALSQYGDERQSEHGVLFTDTFQPSNYGLVPSSPNNGALKGGGQLDAPLLLHLADAEQGGSQNRDNDGGDDGEGPFIVQLAVRPVVYTNGIEGAYDGGGYYQTDEET